MSGLPVAMRRQVLAHPLGWIASGFGAGFSPRAPGTVGSAVALLPWFFWMQDLPALAYLALLAISFVIGVWASHWVVRHTGINDPSLVVWDEFVGLWIALFALPTGWPWVLAAFGLFRLFDIWKPWPVRWADRKLHGGFGVMFDDVLAGLYALALLQLFAHYL